MKRAKGQCVVSCHVSAPCATCGERADPCHIIDGEKPILSAPFATVTDSSGTRIVGGSLSSERSTTMYCARCCPEHGAPLLAVSDAGDRA